MSEASGAGFKHCLIAWDRSGAPWLRQVTVPREATVADLLVVAAREFSAQFPALGNVDPAGQTVGIWGRAVPPGHVPVAGDRLEIYRPLPLDPRARRRQQLAASRRAKSGARSRRGS